MPEELLTEAGSPRDPHAGDPLVGFRHDQTWLFLQSILDQRPVEPSFLDGLHAQIVMDAIEQIPERQRGRRSRSNRSSSPW